MAFKKITTGNIDAYVDFGSEIKIIVPGVGSVKLTKDSFVKLLNYFRGYDFLLAKQEVGVNSYYPVGNKDIGYFVEDSSGNLIIVAIDVVQTGKFSNVTFKTLDTKTAKVSSELALNHQMVSRIVAEANVAGIASNAKEYAGVQFVDALPAETSAKRFTVYLKDKKYYTLNAAEDALDTIDVIKKSVLPVAETEAEENVVYTLRRPQDIPDSTQTFKPGSYTYTKAKNTFKLEDINIRTVDKLPKVEKADKSIIYLLSKDMKDEHNAVQFGKGKYYATKDNTSYTEDTRKFKTVEYLPYAELAEDGKFYLVDNTVSKFVASDKKFTKIGKLVVLKGDKELPDVKKITLDPNYIYTLIKDDGEHKAYTSYTFDSAAKSFTAYKDPTKETTPASPPPSTPVQQH